MAGIWPWLTENFNNRELAGAFWLTLVFSLLFLKKDVRNGIGGIIKAAAAPKLRVLFLGYAGFVALLAWLDISLGLWTNALITPTVVWYFVGGLPLLFRAFDAKEGTQHFRGYATSVLSGTALLEFLYVAKTFSLPAELVLTPIVTVVALLAAVSERDPEHSAVNNLMTWLLAVFAIVVFWNSISQIWAEPKDFFTTTTFRTFCLPIYLTIGSIPFFYLIHCYSHIESARIQIDQKTFQSSDLKAYAKKRFFLTFLLRPWLLRRATRQFHIKPAKEKNDVDAIIREILQHERDTENPPDVSDEEGWSPHAAREFLAEEGMRTGDYHSGYDGEEWWCGVTSKELDDALLPSTANYSFLGIEGLVTQIKLRGHFRDEFVKQEALDEFSRLSQLLAKRAIPRAKIEEVFAKLEERQPFQISNGETKAKLMHERFPNELGFELVFELTRPTE
ncbi:hypothetical protein [Ruegeria sp. HKCCA0370]|uniref:hypothetical protein n=1 Tax=Ruegeria sp. HKCCA0370 TaxID=2682995 RepID=UPI0014889162|nr:hypothetical protein [Ruegeria sp. HKCCA0370]